MGTLHAAMSRCRRAGLAMPSHQIVAHDICHFISRLSLDDVSGSRYDRSRPGLVDHGLRKGDLGAVAEVYEEDGLEVEFVTASGGTAAVLTLEARDVRPVADDDLVS